MIFGINTIGKVARGISLIQREQFTTQLNRYKNHLELCFAETQAVTEKESKSIFPSFFAIRKLLTWGESSPEEDRYLEAQEDRISVEAEYGKESKQYARADEKVKAAAAELMSTPECQVWLSDPELSGNEDLLDLFPDD